MTDVKRKVFYSFHYDENVMRISRTTTMNMNKASSNELEEVKLTKNWEIIDENHIIMYEEPNHIMYKQPSIMSIKRSTYEHKRKCVEDEIKKLLEEDKPIHIIINNKLTYWTRIYPTCEYIMCSLDKWIKNEISDFLDRSCCDVKVYWHEL